MTATDYPQTTTRKFSGIVKWFQPSLGYGFIAVAPSVKMEFGIDPEFDLFFHAKEVKVVFPRKLQAEDRVQFSIVVASKGPRAINVEPAGKRGPGASVGAGMNTVGSAQ